MLVAGSATLIMAALSWFAFEKPLNALKRHFPYVRPNGGFGAVPMSTVQADDWLLGRTDEGLRPVYLPGAGARGKTLQASDLQ